MSKKDNLSVEYEARAMIDENQYLALLSFHKQHARTYKEIVNVNTYFDTDNRDLIKNHVMLRIREIDGIDDELTLKIKGDKGDLEITRILNKRTKKRMLEKAIIPSLKIRKVLKEKGINLKELKLVTSLKTERMEVYLRSYTFVIDKNYYNGKVDYNIEVEAKTRGEAKKHLDELGALVGVSHQDDYISKSKRAILGL